MGSISFLFPHQESDRGNEDHSPIRTTTLLPTSMDSIDTNTITARYVEHMFGEVELFPCLMICFHKLITRHTFQSGLTCYNG